MTETQICELTKLQRNYFQSGATLNTDFRMEALKRLKAAIQKYTKEI